MSELAISEDQNEQHVLCEKDSTSADSEDSGSDLGHSVGDSASYDYSSDGMEDTLSLQGNKIKRVVLPIDEDPAYKEVDSGVGDSVGSYSALLEKASMRKTRTDSETCDIDCDRYMDGIDIHERSISIILKQSSTKSFRYPKLEKNHRTLQVMCQSENYKRCTIDILGSHEAVCKAIDEKDGTPEIKISGRSRCGKCFSGDEVVVHILKRPEYIPRLQRQVTDDTEWYGEVAGFLQHHRFRNVKHPVMLCVFDYMDSRNNMVRPICRTVPKIYVRHRKETANNEIEIYEHNDETKQLTFSRVEKSVSSGREQVVLLVAYITWTNEMYPKGVVLKIIQKGRSVGQDISLLRYEKHIKQDFTEDALDAAMSLVCKRGEIFSNLQSQGYKEETRQNIFTISKYSMEKSTAFSFRKLNDWFTEIGIFVVDVASIIPKGSYLDKEAMARGGSLRGNICERTMLPTIIERSFSFAEDIIVPAISVFFVADQYHRYVQNSVSQGKSLVRCSIRMSHQEVQNIINYEGAKCRFCEKEDTCHIRHLYKIARNLRSCRLGVASFAESLRLDITHDPEEIVKQEWYAELIVEELTIFVNFYYANMLLQRRYHFPILGQEPPVEQKVIDWKKSYGHFSKFVVCLQDCHLRETITINDKTLDKLRYTWIIGLQLGVWKDIKKSVRQGQLQNLQRLVCTDDLHPLVALAKENWKSFQSKEEYRVSKIAHRNILDQTYPHFSLRLIVYIEAHEPFQRYADLANQRLVHTLFPQSTQLPYEFNELESICFVANQWKRKTRNFDKEYNKAMLANRLASKPLLLTGFVSEVSTTQIRVFVPGFDSVGDENIVTVDLPHLLPYGDTELGKDPVSERPFIRVKWQKRIYSVDKNRKAPDSKSKEKRINPHQKAHFIQLNEWRTLLKRILSHERSFDNFIRDRESLLAMAPESRKTVLEVSGEVPKDRVFNQLCSFQTTFNIGQILSLQVCSTYEQGKLQIRPQVLDLTHNVKFCLTHVSDPVGSFEMHNTENIKKEYKSLKEYGEAWSSALLMDAACNAVTEDAMTINDIDVAFSEIGGVFELDKTFCEIRDMDLFNIPLDFFCTPNSDEIYTTSRADYICIKCPVSEFETENADEYADDMQYVILHGKLSDASAGNRTERKTIQVNFVLNMNCRNLHSLTGQWRRCFNRKYCQKEDIVR